MNMKFTKMHGLGNDFMVIDGINQTIKLTPQYIAYLSQRHTGIGFDQMLLIERSETAGIDFTYRIFNANGQEVGQCGNGARCLALFAKHYGLTNKNDLIVATKTTQMTLHIHEDNTVRVDMGMPKLEPQNIPFLTNHQESEYHLPLSQGKTATLHALSVGNPHAVLLVDDVELAPVQEWGEQISIHSCFPEQTNVGFMQILTPRHIKLRVYERGCAETLACGSGAVAAAAAGRLFHHLEKQITVTLPGGDLIIDWPEFNEPITLTGSATFVYEGMVF